MSSPKDIVLFIDGTGQGPEKPNTNPTNVEGFAYFLNAEPLRSPDASPRSLDGKSGIRAPGSSAVTSYLSGVGADTSPVFDWFPGGTGYGIAHTIRLAYKFLITHYQPLDRIFLFGFSRGAFAARSLAGFVDCVGVGLRDVPADWLDQAIDQAYFAYEYLQGDTEALRLGISEYLQEYLRGSTHDIREPNFDFASLPIYLIGIWDAVEALGLPAKASLATRVFNSYHQTKLPPNVSHAFHALSLHELRSDFQPHLWTNKHNSSQILEQRWFAGDHSDVGGGHPNRQLSDISLLWMLGCAEQAGFTAVRQLAKNIAQPAVPSNINQRWQDLIFCVLPPKVRPALQSYDELSNPLPLDSSFDPSVSTRLSSGHEIDYSQFRIGFGKTFGVRSHDVQISALRQVDQFTIKGLLRLDPRFLELNISRQVTLLNSATMASWSAADKDLSFQAGEQAAENMRLGAPLPVKVNRPFGESPPWKKSKDGEKQ
ncbi:MAG TPA: DUF2235 domain-containing protein [Terracidiphilus sp.]